MEQIYSSDLSDNEYKVIETYIPESKPGGRPRSVNIRLIINAIFYLLKTGCQWRMLPRDYPPWSTVYYYFRKWSVSGDWHKIHELLRKKVRVSSGKNENPSVGIIDSQSVKTTQIGGTRGYDGNKKVNGRRRHILVDTLGLLITKRVEPGNIQDRAAAYSVLSGLEPLHPRIKKIWADGGYISSKLSDWLKKSYNWTLEVVKRVPGTFKILRKRWIVERTFGWFNLSRRLSKDYEYYVQTSEALLEICMIRIMIRRLAM